jgi:phosphoglycolate phosphatase-like HAD superfamily hydrolase
MFEEVQACRFEVGPGKQVEALEGSTWDKKMPKDEVMQELCHRLSISPENVLVVGDGRTEIKAGAEMGAVVMSRLAGDARRLRELHKELGAHYIVEDYTSPVLKALIHP